MAEILGARDAVIGRELTKRFEEIRRGTLDALAPQLAAAEEAGRVRGEIVLAVAGRGRAPDGDDAEASAASLDELLRAGLAAGEPLSEVARSAAGAAGDPAPRRLPACPRAQAGRLTALAAPARRQRDCTST